MELSPKDQQTWFRQERVAMLHQAGQAAEAVTEVDELAKSPSWNADKWYDFACVYAVASGKLADKKEEYAKRSMELLNQAVKAGYTDAAHWKKNNDLDALHGRDDFKKLLEELENAPKK